MALPALEWKELQEVVCEERQSDRELILARSAKPGRLTCTLMGYVQMIWANYILGHVYLEYISPLNPVECT